MKEFFEFIREEKLLFLIFFILFIMLFTIPPYIDSLFPSTTTIIIKMG